MLLAAGVRKGQADLAVYLYVIVFMGVVCRLKRTLRPLQAEHRLHGTRLELLSVPGRQHSDTNLLHKFPHAVSVAHNFLKSGSTVAVTTSPKKFAFQTTLAFRRSS